MENSQLFARALQVMKENFGHMTEISLGTSAENLVAVRDLNAFYQDGKMYFLARTSNTIMRNIAVNKNVGLCHGAHKMYGTAKSLGHPAESHNAELRKRLKKEFSLNYDEYAKESDPETVIVEITLTHAETFSRYHRYKIDFAKGLATRDHRVPSSIYR